jgi:catechol 2,3-dioxygenase-like lactoylglutathione lyase family enzyme
VIIAAHALLFAEDPNAARAFLRDVLGFQHVDTGDGWLIFKLPPAEVGVHPTDGSPPSGQSELYLMCDDIDATVHDLRAKGVEFMSDVTATRFGRLVRLKVPGAGEIGLYQPSHAVAHSL